MQITMNAEYLSQRLACSYEDKLECLETVQDLYVLSRFVRKEGILLLDEITDNLTDPFLKAAVFSAPPHIDHLHEVLLSYLVAGNYHGKEFLKNLLITEALPCICDCMLPSVILDYLQGWFGAEFAPIYRKAALEYLHPDEPQEMENSILLQGERNHTEKSH